MDPTQLLTRAFVALPSHFPSIFPFSRHFLAQTSSIRVPLRPQMQRALPRHRATSFASSRRHRNVHGLFQTPLPPSRSSNSALPPPPTSPAAAHRHVVDRTSHVRYSRPFYRCELHPANPHSSPSFSTIRPPPHRDYLSGYPGIPASTVDGASSAVLDPIEPLPVVQRSHAHLVNELPVVLPFLVC